MRLQEIQEADLSPEQLAVLRAIQSGPRKQQHGSIGLVGPFSVWVRAPKIGLPTQALGAAARYESDLPESVKEVAICTVGAFYRAKFEFAAHARLAAQAGVAKAAIEKLRLGQEPQLDGGEALAHAVARELVTGHRIDDATYVAACDTFGETGLIELVGIIGYYCMVSLTLNAFEVPLTDGMEDPFPDD
jgi:4-carboxymuconolactone decarboxylase